MGITVSWDDKDNTIIRYDVSGLWSWDDYCAAVQQIAAMLDRVDHPAGVIANFHADTILPTGDVPTARRKAASRKKKMPDKLGVVVVAGGYSFLEVILSGFCKVYKRVGKRFFAADSLDEARHIIHERLSGAAKA